MSTPAIIILALFAMSAGLSLGQHGQPKTGNENFYVTIFSQAVIGVLLYWGGFFS